MSATPKERQAASKCPYCGGPHTLSKCPMWKIQPPKKAGGVGQ